MTAEQRPGITNWGVFMVGSAGGGLAFAIASGEGFLVGTSVGLVLIPIGQDYMRQRRFERALRSSLARKSEVGDNEKSK